MIQDIAPHVYDNAFAVRRPPKEGDLLILCREGELLLRKEEAAAPAAWPEEDGTLSFPAVQDIPDVRAFWRECREQDQAEQDAGDEQTEPRGGAPAENGFYRMGGMTLVYLFCIDRIAFYGADGESRDRIAGTLTGEYDWVPFRKLRNAKPNVLAYAGVTALQLARWREEHHFCGKCGEKMRPSETERAYVCPSCGLTVYPKISPAVIVAVIDRLKEEPRILLTKYAGRTYANYALIAGFAEIGETIEDTVRREVMEEVGLHVKNLHFYKSQPWSFSDSLLMGFYCELDGSSQIHLQEEELALGEWKTREEMPVRSSDISLTSEMMERFRQGLV